MRGLGWRRFTFTDLEKWKWMLKRNRCLIWATLPWSRIKRVGGILMLHVFVLVGGVATRFFVSLDLCSCGSEKEIKCAREGNRHENE